MPDKTIQEQLMEEGYRFNFFQAIRVLEWLNPERDPVGREASPGREVVRFHSLPSLSFPPSPIYEVKAGEGPDEPLHMTVAFMGLTGPQGVLPRHYTEMVLDRLRERDRTLLEFFDLFTHRFVSLFYRAWEKHYVPNLYERAVGRQKGNDPISASLMALMGMGTKGLKENLGFHDSTLLGYVGLLGQRPRSATSLQQMLQDYFQLPVMVKQFIGEWLNFSAEHQTKLSSREMNNVLGETAIAGTQIWDQQARFHLNIGPLNLADFTKMVPSGKMYKALVQLTRFFAGQDLNFDVRLILKAEEVPACKLKETEIFAPRLGWTTWLKCQEFTQDVDDVVFSGEADWQAPSVRRVAVA